MCPYDHGVDPVVLEDSALSGVLTFAPNGAPINDMPPQMMGPPGLGHMPPRPLMHDQAPYNPQVTNKEILANIVCSKIDIQFGLI